MYKKTDTEYRYRAKFVKRPEDQQDERMDKLYKICEYQNVTQSDMDIIWPDWNPTKK